MRKYEKNLTFAEESDQHSDAAHKLLQSHGSLQLFQLILDFKYVKCMLSSAC